MTMEAGDSKVATTSILKPQTIELRSHIIFAVSLKFPFQGSDQSPQPVGRLDMDIRSYGEFQLRQFAEERGLVNAELFAVPVTASVRV